VPHGEIVTIGNKQIELEAEQEEMLLAWANKIGTPYVDDPVFQENFLLSLRERWPDAFQGIQIADIIFEPLKKRADDEKLSEMPEERRKVVSAERKRVREALKEKYGWAQVDDHTVEIGAYLVEPPGIFMGRGAHPLRGRWKPRVHPGQVTLNLDEDAPIYKAEVVDPEGIAREYDWGGIVHEHDSMWVARWLETLTNKVKYVWLAETSHLRQARDQEKYEKAHMLTRSLDQVRRAIREGMRDKHERRRKVATVAYLIDRLAMRVGDEKDEDEADTVGATTLRVEHVHIGEDQIVFDFLGKDSVRWEKTLSIAGEDKVLARNLREFTEGKAPNEQVFPEITSAQVNGFFRSILPGLSAKVFRTYHATTTVEQFLKKEGRSPNGSSAYAKEHTARLANLEAAIMCNHKRTVPKTFEESLKKREEALEKLRLLKPDLGRLDTQIDARRSALAKLEQDAQEFERRAPELLKKKQAALAALEAKPVPEGDTARKLHEKRLRAANKAAREAEKANRAKLRRYKERIAAAKSALANARQARGRAEKSYQERVERAELALELARRTRDYNLNTSLKNYIDPRTYRDWGEKVGFDWTRLYTSALKRKFQWALTESETEE
jgi:DNA topoisomerase-1